MPALAPPRVGAAVAVAGAGAAADWLAAEPPRDAQPAVASNATATVAAHRAADELILILIECSSL
jgi:hypothetical protein